MIKNNFNAQGYKAPVCKVVRVHVEGALMGASDGIDNIEEDDVENQTSNWGL